MRRRAAARPPERRGARRRAAPGRREGPQGRRRARPRRGYVVAPCEKAKGRAVDDFVARELHTARRKATPEAVEALRVAIGDDLRSLSAACAQLVSDVEDDPLTAESVALYYDGVADVPGYLVSDAVLGGRAVEVLRRSRWALANDPGAGPALSAAVASGLRGLARVASIPRGTSEAEVAREAGVPPFKVRSLREQAVALAPRVAGRRARGDGRGRRRGQGPLTSRAAR